VGSFQAASEAVDREIIMEKPTKKEVISSLQDVITRLEKENPVALFAVLAVPEGKAGEQRVRFLFHSQGSPTLAAAVAVAFAKNTAGIVGEFDQWMRAAGFTPGKTPGKK
jgi:hypothetical protein